MDKIRVVHYINQFFAQIGGEEKADYAPEYREGAVGPGLALNAAFKGEAEIVGTVICGDSYFNENLEWKYRRYFYRYSGKPECFMGESSKSECGTGTWLI